MKKILLTLLSGIIFINLSFCQKDSKVLNEVFQGIPVDGCIDCIYWYMDTDTNFVRTYAGMNQVDNGANFYEANIKKCTSCKNKPKTSTFSVRLTDNYRTVGIPRSDAARREYEGSYIDFIMSHNYTNRKTRDDEVKVLQKKLGKISTRITSEEGSYPTKTFYLKGDSTNTVKVTTFNPSRDNQNTYEMRISYFKPKYQCWANQFYYQGKCESYDKPNQLCTQMPKFPGGDSAMFRFIQSKVKEAINFRNPGVYKNGDFDYYDLTFIINKEGKAISPKITRYIHAAISDYQYQQELSKMTKLTSSPEQQQKEEMMKQFKKEILHAIDQMPEWSPGQCNGQNENALLTYRLSPEDLLVH